MSNVTALAAAAILVAPLTLTGLAQQRTAATVRADDIAANPDRYLGQQVRVRASVEDVFNEFWFSIDDDSEWSTGRDLLVVNPSAAARADDDEDVVITGRIVTFTEVQSMRPAFDDHDDFGLAPDLVVQFTRRPVLLAESIVTEGGDQLVRRSGAADVYAVTFAGPAESVKTGDIEDDIEEYIGTTVKTESEVDKLYSRSIFTIDDDVVVVAPGLNEAVSRDMDVTVVGTVIRFDRVGIEREARGYVVDLLAEAERELMGRPVIIAHSVRTESGVELMGPASTMGRREARTR